MEDYEYAEIEDKIYSIPREVKPRKKEPPLVVVMNDQCTACSGAPMCVPQCPVDCIHLVYEKHTRRPDRVYVDTDVCIGCLNCFSFEVRPKHINKGDPKENAEKYNNMDLMKKKGVCPWDAIEVHLYEEGVGRSKEFYVQPREALRPVASKEGSG